MHNDYENARPGEPDLVVTVFAKGNAAIRVLQALSDIEPPPVPPKGQAVALELNVGPITEQRR